MRVCVFVLCLVVSLSKFKFCYGFAAVFMFFFPILLMFGEKNIRVCEDVTQQYWNVGIEPP